MNTQENNKLIAEFMGLEYSPKDKRWDDWFTKEGAFIMNELEKITECKKYLAYIKQKYGTTDVNTIKNLIK